MSNSNDYKLEFDKRILSKLKKLEKHERALLFKLITKILEDPYKGKTLRYSLKGLRRVVFEHYPGMGGKFIGRLSIIQTSLST